jgi:hypothetical protein
MCVRRCQICCPIWVKFGMTDQHILQLRICEFREYRLTESLNFINRVNGMAWQWAVLLYHILNVKKPLVKCISCVTVLRCRLKGCTLYVVHCTLYTVRCTLYPVRCILYTVRCKLYAVHCTRYAVYCTLYIVLCTLYTVHCTLYSVRCILYTVRCTLTPWRPQSRI